ncbi:hypothetical protein ACO2Q0_01815 [Phenylobacterium sp. VNQ135]|uniref:hypothetical protein n=1 Tax=Phenylobacterium sp. VNQ135 TaxID=3400922 RepID=UPI003C015BFC
MADERRSVRGLDERRDEYSLSVREQGELAKAPKKKDRRLDMRDIAGKVWSSPNTALGLAYGLAGYAAGQANRLRPGDQPDPRIQVGNNAVQFVNNPLGGVGAITLGNTITYKDDPYSPYDAPYLGHERSHTLQGQQLGPFYLPSNLLGGLNGLLRDRDWHGAHNWNEQGPRSTPPTPWGPRKR